MKCRKLGGLAAATALTAGAAVPAVAAPVTLPAKVVQTDTVYTASLGDGYTGAMTVRWHSTPSGRRYITADSWPVLWYDGARIREFPLNRYKVVQGRTVRYLSKAQAKKGVSFPKTRPGTYTVVTGEWGNGQRAKVTLVSSW